MIDEEVEEFLEHYGVKGMRWGKRAAKATGRGSLVVGKAAGRGIKKTAIYAKNNPKTAAKIAAGAAFAATLMTGRHRVIQKEKAEATARGAKEAARIFSQAGSLTFIPSGSSFVFKG